MMSDDKLYESLPGVSTRLDALLTRIEKGDGSMGRLINDPEFYNNMNGAAEGPAAAHRRHAAGSAEVLAGQAESVLT